MRRIERKRYASHKSDKIHQHTINYRENQYQKTHRTPFAMRSLDKINALWGSSQALRHPKLIKRLAPRMGVTVGSNKMGELYHGIKIPGK
jgi:hypothetical protein